MEKLVEIQKRLNEFKEDNKSGKIIIFLKCGEISGCQISEDIHYLGLEAVDNIKITRKTVVLRST